MDCPSFVKKHQKSLYYSLLVLLSLLVGFLGTLLFSYSLSPLFPQNNGLGVDSNILQVIGQAIADGKTPYVDIVDHKGPFLFYWGYLGAVIHPAYGFYVLQSLMNAIVFFCVFDTGRIIGLKKGYLLIYALFASIFLFINHEGAATDYSFLPCAFIPFYLFVFSLYKPSVLHFSITIFIDGFLLGIMLFTRANNSIIQCLIALGIVIYTVKERKLRQLPLYVLIGVSGILVSSTIALVSSYLGGYLNEMLTWTFLKNFNYSGSTASFDLQRILVMILVLVLAAIFIFFLHIEKKFLKEKNLTLYPFLCSSLVIITLFNLLFSFFFHHLTMSYVVYFLLTAYSFLLLEEKKVLENHRKLLPIISSLESLSIVVYIAVFQGVYRTMVDGEFGPQNITMQHLAKEYIEEHTTKENPVIYAIDCNANIYLNLGEVPDFPVFTLQSWWDESGVYQDAFSIISYVEDEVDYLFINQQSNFLKLASFLDVLSNEFNEVISLRNSNIYYFYERIN